jgi:hypothetical protein
MGKRQKALKTRMVFVFSSDELTKIDPRVTLGLKFKNLGLTFATGAGQGSRLHQEPFSNQGTVAVKSF